MRRVKTLSGRRALAAPASVRHLGDKPAAAGAASVPANHVGLGPGLIDEDQASRVKPALMLPPPQSPPGDVGAVLFTGVQAFFERDPSLAKNALSSVLRFSPIVGFENSLVGIPANHSAGASPG